MKVNGLIEVLEKTNKNKPIHIYEPDLDNWCELRRDEVEEDLMV